VVLRHVVRSPLIALSSKELQNVILLMQKLLSRHEESPVIRLQVASSRLAATGGSAVAMQRKRMQGMGQDVTFERNPCNVVS